MLMEKLAVKANPDWPRISVVTPSYQQGQFIRETIDSVLAQGYPNLEFIIIDGGSTDDTVEIVSGYAERISHFVSEADRGQSHAINKGFGLATGEILCWLNSDDQLAPDALATVALAFRVHAPDMVAGICEVYEGEQLVHRHLTSCADGPLPLSELLDLDRGWNAGQFFYQPEVFFSRSLWDKAGGYVREDVHFSMDYELWCRFALHKARLKVLGSPLARFRSHSGQKTHDIPGFKKELKTVRESFCKKFGVRARPSTRPRVDWSKRLRIALVNDLGFLYGAGIAHLRLAASLDLASHTVEAFSLVRADRNQGDYPELLEAIRGFEPDLVVLGNFHAVERSSVQFLEKLESEWSCFWVTHDFWLLTGRCAYMGSCPKYLEICDAMCPTADEYPPLPRAEIAPAWRAKRAFLGRARQLRLLANSSWAHQRAEQALAGIPGCRIAVDPIKLGFPVEAFASIDRRQARKALNIADDEVCLAFSSSSISDSRKGSDLLVAALQLLQAKKLVLLLIGRVDTRLDIEGVRAIYTGYLDDQEKIAQALGAADLYVAPSREETFGQVFIEAALAGTPSVGFAASGIADAIIDGITGFLVQEISAKALAQRLDTLLAQPELIQAVGATAPIYARSHFSLEACYHSLFRAFDQAGLIDSKGLPHKIGYKACSPLIGDPGLALQRPSQSERLMSVPRRLVQWLVACLPQPFKDRVRTMLPAWLDRWLVRLIFGPDG